MGRACAQAGATERKSCSPATASRKLRIPSPPLGANLESGDLDAGDNGQHQRGGRSINSQVPTEALPPPTPHGSVQPGLSAEIIGCAASGLGGAADKRCSLGREDPALSNLKRTESTVQNGNTRSWLEHMSATVEVNSPSLGLMTQMNAEAVKQYLANWGTTGGSWYPQVSFQSMTQG